MRLPPRATGFRGDAEPLLKEAVEHHVAEERSDLFPRVRKLLDSAQLDALGQEMLAMTESMNTQSPRLAEPAQTKHAAPQP